MKIILVDDEKSTLHIMEKMISKIPGMEISGVFHSTCEAYRFLKENRVDIAFVDIQMPEENGLDFARRIMSENLSIYLVFLTSYKEYALEAFDVFAFDYIVKPVSQERLELTIRKAIQRQISPISYRDSGIPANLYVYCLGGFNIKGIYGEMVQLNSSKSFELLAYLLLNKGKFISKWSVIEDVFREMPPRNAETYLNTTIYKLRTALENYGMREAVISANESYMIDIKDMYVDFIEFENHVNALGIIDETNLEDALKAEKLFEGELLGDKGYYWSLPERERLFEVYWDFAKKLAVYLLENNNLTVSLQILKKLRNMDALDMELNHLLMRIYTAKKDKISLIRQYDRYVKALQRELNVAPGENTTALYEALRRSLE